MSAGFIPPRETRYTVYACLLKVLQRFLHRRFHHGRRSRRAHWRVGSLSARSWPFPFRSLTHSLGHYWPTRQILFIYKIFTFDFGHTSSLRKRRCSWPPSIEPCITSALIMCIRIFLYRHCELLLSRKSVQSVHLWKIDSKCGLTKDLSSRIASPAI